MFSWKKKYLDGCATAIATPFTEKGVNFKELEKLIEFQISQGIHALVVCGTTGESTTMSEQEKKETMKFAIDVVNKRVPVILGTGSNNTATAISNTQYAQSIGADGVLVVTPYYNKTTQAGLISHYIAIAQSTTLPIILYNVPSRTGVNILPSTCLELSKIENIVAIKEASGNISQVAQIAALCKDNLAIYSGNDDQTLPILSLGGSGVISVLSNIAPKLCVDMINAWEEGNLWHAQDLQIQSLDLIEALFSEVNPIPVKHALNHMGFDFGKPRLPLVELSNEHKSLLENCMEKHGIIKI